MDGLRVHGMTLIELIIAIGIVAILAALATPAFLTALDKHRLIGVAESIGSQLAWARSEAVKSSTEVYVSFNTRSGWCLGVNDGGPCNCTSTGDCAVGEVERVVTDTDFRTDGASPAYIEDVAFAGGSDSTRFDPVRGTARAGHVHLQSAGGLRLRLVISPLGLIRLCSPTGTTHVAGYPSENCS